MLTDEELTARLELAFRQDAPTPEYAGRVPHVHHRRGLAATSVLAGATALALAPAALQQTQDRAPDALPSARPGVHHSPPAGPSVTHTLDVAGLHLTYAATAGRSGLAFEIGNAIELPPDAQKVDVDVPADVWFATEPATGEPAMYVRAPGTSQVYGVIAPGWTRQQLIDLLEHGSQH